MRSNYNSNDNSFPGAAATLYSDLYRPLRSDETNRATDSDSYGYVTGNISIESDGRIDAPSLFASGTVPTERETVTHEGPDHCEAGAAGRAIVGVTAPDGRLLLVTNPGLEHAVLPSTVVEAEDSDWAGAARDHVLAAAGIEVELEGLRLLRRVEHTAGGEPVDVTHHALYAAAAPDDRIPDGRCADNDWALGWYDEHPYPDAEAGSATADIERALEW